MRIVFHVDASSQKNGNTFEAVRQMVLASGLPFEPAKVNKKWPRMSYGPLVSQGQRAQREYLDIYLRTFVCAAEVKKRLEAAAPEGISLLSVERVPYPLPSVQNLAAAVRYLVTGDFSRFPGRQMTWESFVGAEKILITRCAQNGMVITWDAAPYLVESMMTAPNEILCTLQCVQDKWIRPEWLLAAWLGVPIPLQEEAFCLEGISITRQCLLWRDSQGELHPI